jgi:hypothetical protein
MDAGARPNQSGMIIATDEDSSLTNKTCDNHESDIEFGFGLQTELIINPKRFAVDCYNID